MIAETIELVTAKVRFMGAEVLPPNLKQCILRAGRLQAAKFRVTPVAGMEDTLLEVTRTLGRESVARPGFGFPEPAVDGILCAPESIRIERTGVRLYGGHGREIERIAD
jgi:hypothetical protein